MKWYLKKELVGSLCATILLGSAGPAQAQSSVTLYGMVDNGIAYNSNAGAGSLVSASAKHANQFWGITGREDLGGGLAAVFDYNNYIFINNGGSIPRTAYMGLDDKTFGRLTMGRQFDFLVDMDSFLSERWMSVTGVHPGDYDRTAGVPTNNLIEYQSTVVGGLQASFLYSFGTSTSDSNLGRGIGGKLNFTSGGFEAIALYESINGVPATPGMDLGVPSLYGINFLVNPSAAVYQSESIAGLGVAYGTNDWRVMGAYTNTRLKANGIGETMQTGDVGFYKFLRPDIQVGMGYSYTKLGSYDWNMVHAHIDYFLSKTTDLYLRTVFEQTGTNQRAVLFLEPVSSNNRQLVIGVGVTHAF